MIADSVGSYHPGSKDPGCGGASFLRKYPSAVAAGSVETPCGGCSACCRAGYTVSPVEGDSLELFTGTDDQGGSCLPTSEDGVCDYLGPEGCAVYDRRPFNCRTYDCRVFAISGVFFDENASPQRKSVNAAAMQWDVRSMLRTYDDKVAIAAARIAAYEARERGVSTVVEVLAALGVSLYRDYIKKAEAALLEAQRFARARDHRGAEDAL